MSLRDRLSSLAPGELVALLVVLAAVIAGAGVWYARSLPRPVAIGAPTASIGSSVAPAPSPNSVSSSPSPASVVVDVAGEVKRPGVYQLSEGQRVIDAVKAAGGPKRDANLAALNLAAPLADGSQVLVPSNEPAGDGASSGSTTSSAPSGGTALINVNMADATQLEELPDIGEVLAAAIVKYREDNGPFTSIDELDNVSGIGPATLADIRDLVTV